MKWFVPFLALGHDRVHTQSDIFDSKVDKHRLIRFPIYKCEGTMSKVQELELLIKMEIQITTKWKRVGQSHWPRRRS